MRCLLEMPRANGRRSLNRHQLPINNDPGFSEVQSRLLKLLADGGNILSCWAVAGGTVGKDQVITIQPCKSNPPSAVGALLRSRGPALKNLSRPKVEWGLIWSPAH